MLLNIFPVSMAISLVVCLSVRLHNNSKTNDPKVFKLATGNDLGIAFRQHDFGVRRSRLWAR